MSQQKTCGAGGRAGSRLPLREHRLRAGVTLEAIMSETKISRRFLEAIEEGRYEELPGGVFAVNYIRQYAQMMGYDAELILDHYRSRTDREAQEPRGRQAPVARWVRFFQSA